jgi:hypothetical protein
MVQTPATLVMTLSDRSYQPTRIHRGRRRGILLKHAIHHFQTAFTASGERARRFAAQHARSA